MIRVEVEPWGEAPYEACCFCHTPTAYWTVIAARKPGQQVACCQDCSKLYKVKDVPTKEDWCGAERARRQRAPHLRIAVEDIKDVRSSASRLVSALEKLRGVKGGSKMATLVLLADVSLGLIRKIVKAAEEAEKEIVGK
jgi:hypothetical protein